ncbi:serine hydrolase domain-containing protein [Hamadaea tsunoensis]|uniref:serine hydrolase domain-containing protein n=1 Tax=Hamadaea tsunoensis TaxID=53368 RepID=UPI0006856862|nr:serine hydrolase domain-containing protein [Hamadaea tsunoensis]
MPALAQLLADGAYAQPPRYSAAVAVIQRYGTRTHAAAVGQLGRFADTAGTPAPAHLAVDADESTVFDFASITKMFTAVVMLTLVEQGVLGLDEPVAGWLASFQDGQRRQVTLRHLLSHTSGLPAVLPLATDWPDRDARVAAVLNAPLRHAPGTAFEYSCVGFMLAGFLAEQVTGQTLPELVAERICRPLGLADTGFRPAAPLVARTAATELQPDRGLVHGSVHDESSWSLGGTAGNAGIFGTATDLARFGEMLRSGGSPILRKGTVAEMTRDQLRPELDPGYRHGLGVRIADPQSMGMLARSGAYGHTGFTGTSLVVDPGRGLVVVLLTNRVHPSRDWSTVADLRQAVAHLAAGG